jgi:hypothetical protein
MKRDKARGAGVREDSVAAPNLARDVYSRWAVLGYLSGHTLQNANLLSHAPCSKLPIMRLLKPTLVLLSS